MTNYVCFCVCSCVFVSVSVDYVVYILLQKGRIACARLVILKVNNLV